MLFMVLTFYSITDRKQLPIFNSNSKALRYFELIFKYSHIVFFLVSYSTIWIYFLNVCNILYAYFTVYIIIWMNKIFDVFMFICIYNNLNMLASWDSTATLTINSTEKKCSIKKMLKSSNGASKVEKKICINKWNDLSERRDEQRKYFFIGMRKSNKAFYTVYKYTGSNIQ